MKYLTAIILALSASSAFAGYIFEWRGCAGFCIEGYSPIPVEEKGKGNENKPVAGVVV